MAETTQIMYNHKEIAEILVREGGMTEGHWGLLIKFGITGANISIEGKIQPTALVPVVGIGLQRFEEPNELTVDAALINTGAKAPAKKATSKEATVKAAAKTPKKK